MADVLRIKYGFWLAVIGLAAVMLVYVVAIRTWTTASEVATVVSSVAAFVGTIVGAFFGVQVGALGKEKAEAERSRAQEQVRELVGILPPNDYQQLRKDRADLFGATNG